MGMPKIIPPHAVGLCVLISPGRFWNTVFLDRDYVKWARRAIDGLAGMSPPEQLEKVARDMLIAGSTRAIDPAIRQLPLEHPLRQEILKACKIGLSLFAYLRKTQFFILVLDDDDVRYENLPATSIKHAQELILARDDVRAIERDVGLTWEPTPVH